MPRRRFPAPGAATPAPPRHPPPPWESSTGVREAQARLPPPRRAGARERRIRVRRWRSMQGWGRRWCTWRSNRQRPPRTCLTHSTAPPAARPAIFTCPFYVPGFFTPQPMHQAGSTHLLDEIRPRNDKPTGPGLSERNGQRNPIFRNSAGGNTFTLENRTGKSATLARKHCIGRRVRTPPESCSGAASTRYRSSERSQPRVAPCWIANRRQQPRLNLHLLLLRAPRRARAVRDAILFPQPSSSTQGKQDHLGNVHPVPRVLPIHIYLTCLLDTSRALPSSRVLQ